MIAREDWLAWLPAGIMTKEQSYVAESGPGSVTMRALKAGKRTLLVGADGQIFDTPDWPKSRTFRLGQQSNIIVADNQTRFYDGMNNRQRKMYTFLTWGPLDQETEQALARDISRHPPSPAPTRAPWPDDFTIPSWHGENSFGIGPLDAAINPNLTGVRPPLPPNA